jgi:hypothetical protein
MDISSARDVQTIPAKLEPIGRVATVTGSQSTVELTPCTTSGESAIVEKFMGISTGKSVLIGLITEVGKQLFAAAGGSATFRKMARLDLIGELLTAAAGATRFQRGVTEYPNIGDSVYLLT